METGTETNGVERIDQLHAQVIAATPVPAEAPPVVETVGAQADSAPARMGPNSNTCKTVIATICARHSEAVYDEFYNDLEPIAGHDQAERIAKRAAMSPALQEAFSEHGTNVLAKYNLSRFVSDEAVLIGTAFAYLSGLRSARRDRDRILAKHYGVTDPGTKQPGTSQEEAK